MARKLRYMKNCPATFEVTVRTIQGRFLLRPSELLNSIILGIIGRAQKAYPVELHLKVVASDQKVRNQSPHTKAKKLKKRPAPLCHSSDPEERRRYRDDYRWFVTLFHRASAKLRVGDLGAVFPGNCFPPPLAYASAGVGPPT